MSKAPYLLFAIFVASMLFQPGGLADEVSGQLVGDCSISSTPSTMVIDVSPGSPGIGVSQIDVENPTPHTEVIRIEAQTGGLAYAVPGTITLGPYSSINFQLSVKANQRASVGSINAKISCTVETMDGLPNPNPVPKDSAFIISIRQFAFMRVQAEKAFDELNPKTDYTLVFTIFNDGNFIDKLDLEITNREELEKKGWSISLTATSIEIGESSSEQVRVQVRTPKKQGWSDDYYSLQFRATSQFSKDFESVEAPESAEAWVTMYVRGFYLPGFSYLLAIIPLLGVAALIGAMRSVPRGTPRTSSSGSAVWPPSNGPASRTGRPPVRRS